MGEKVTSVRLLHEYVGEIFSFITVLIKGQIEVDLENY